MSGFLTAARLAAWPPPTRVAGKPDPRFVPRSRVRRRTPPAAEITQLIHKQVAESARKVRYYGYLARHLRRINDTLQCIGVLASSIAIFCVLGGLYWFALDSLVLATLSFAIPTLRNDSDRSLRSGEISHQLTQLHLEWEDLWNAARTDSSIDVLPDWKKLSKRQLSILEHVPLDLTLSPRLVRRAQNALHDYSTPAIAAMNRSTAGADSQVESL